MTVPYSFANATVSIPLSQLDANFNTPITLGNTAIQLGNTVTTLNNMTLANVTISSGNVTITNVSVTTANVTTLNAATVIATTANVTTANITTGNVTTANIVTANITTGNVTNMSSGNVAITGGSINGTTLGASTASTANVTTLTTSSTVTINGGTANGVAYLNGSKVLTTGSALTFDGTRFGVNGGLVADNNLVAQINSPASSAKFMGFNRDGGYGLLIGYDLGGVDYATIRTVGNYPISFGINNAEAMRLTSTGLGIGTSSPAYKLDVAGSARLQTSSGYNFFFQTSGTTARINYLNDAFSANISAAYRATDFTWQKGDGSDVLKLDSVGNLGLGVTPSAWNSAYKAIQVGTSASIWGASNAAYLALNAYQDGTGTNRYLNSNFAVLYGSDGNGGFQWRTAPSGTAGNAISFTQAMTLDASGNLLVGTTSASAWSTAGRGLIEVNGSSSALIGLKTGNTQRGYMYTQGTDLIVLANTGALALSAETGSGIITLSTAGSERARITSGGDLLVGTTSATAIGTGYRSINVSGTNGSGVVFKNNAETSFGYAYNDSVNNRFYITQNTAGVYLANGGTSWTSASDERVKDIIEPISDAAAKVSTLRAVIGKYKTDPQEKRRSFLIAQDVQAVLPEAVDATNPDELGLQYADMIPLLVAAIKEQQAIITDLRARVAQLEAK